jgi:hypothetical protein
MPARRSSAPSTAAVHNVDARAVEDQIRHIRTRESAGDEPAKRLHLRALAGRLRPRGQKDDFPLPVPHESRQA